jgi:hypothetical protein
MVEYFIIQYSTDTLLSSHINLTQLNSPGFRNRFRWLHLPLLRHSLLRGGVWVQERYGTVHLISLSTLSPIDCWIHETRHCTSSHTYIILSRSGTTVSLVSWTLKSLTPLVSLFRWLIFLLSYFLPFLLAFFYFLSYPARRFSAASRQYHSHDQGDCFLLVMTTITVWAGMSSGPQTSTTTNCKVRYMRANLTVISREHFAV